MPPEEITFGQKAHSLCHIDPFFCKLDAEMECELVQQDVPPGFLHDDQDATFKVKVCLYGPLLHHLCGKLCVCVHVECLGSGPEKRVGECCWIDLDPCKKPACYECEIKVPAGTLTAGEDGCGQVCCFVATLSSYDLCGDPGHINCWCKGPCVMVHKRPKA